MDDDLFDFVDEGDNQPVSSKIKFDLTDEAPKEEVKEEQIIEDSKKRSSDDREDVVSIPEVKKSRMDDPDWKPAKEYPFKLDPFQQEAVSCIENNESVLVSAHTSAGKTVVAEYAIALCLKRGQRVLYTSPIKALSNQKFREFNEEFGDAGLMTGDVTINPNASCLVMTTEILRSMLYRGSEILREVAWVVFDEIHYMRDSERGVVWEESIILLPDKVRFVFLSATIPNSKEFAEWICKIKSQPCRTIYTDYRPTPLQHYIFPSGGDGLYLVVDDKSRFLEHNFEKAMGSIEAEFEKRGVLGGDGNKGRRKKGSEKQDLASIIQKLLQKHLNPIIVFSFSKMDVEGYAKQLAKIDLVTEKEKTFIKQVFENAMDSLSEVDRKLPQLDCMLPLLMKGIGMHHGGLLPILKEVIEILFQEGLLKILFATETFAMGLNMPAKTVIFTNSRKFDGKDFRWVSSGEYIQMSGRAGRRGLDDKGIVVQMVDEKMDPEACKNMIRGEADPLNSAFHLGYNMLLNLLLVEGADPEFLVSKSFHQFQSQRVIPEMQNEKKNLEDQLDGMTIEDENNVSKYMDLTDQIRDGKQLMKHIWNQPKYLLPLFYPGRVLHIKDGETDWGFGLLIKHQKKGGKKISEDDSSADYVLDVLLNCDPTIDNKQAPKPWTPELKCAGEMRVLPISMTLVEEIYAQRAKLPNDLKPKTKRDMMFPVIKRAMKHPKPIDKRSRSDGMGIQNPEFKRLVQESAKLQTELLKVKKSIYRNSRGLNENVIVHTDTREFKEFEQEVLTEKCNGYGEKRSVLAKISFLEQSILEGEEMVLSQTLVRMKRVMRRLGHIDDNGVVLKKGRVACLITTADELLATELIFSGVFNGLPVADICALCSCLVFCEKGEENPRIRSELVPTFRKFKECARRVAKVSIDAKLPVDENEYVENFKPDLMDVVYAWCHGETFASICERTQLFEGSIIRSIRRLEELIRQMADAAKAMGSEELENKFKEGSAKMKRDIVFAASLYL